VRTARLPEARRGDHQNGAVLVTQVARMDRKLALVMGAHPRDTNAAIEVLREAIDLARADPDAARWFSEAELLGELADEYEAAGRTEDAMNAVREAIAVGWPGHPDGRCRLAEILMRAGRSGEASAIWAQVRADAPDDVWVYNNAGIEYCIAGDHEESLSWLTEGLVIALDRGDPERLVDQLHHWRGRCLVGLGRGSDELQARAEDHLATRWRHRLERLSLPDSAPMPDGQQETPPTGRNEPCSCGSGRKYKKCCGVPPEQGD
jgi:tetratricopeptide (TPR) repeat protein